MKIVLLIVLLLSALIAQERPKIALVLSGGGARGGAHVGVLKVLEANNIPIDMIVGTSMGSFVGGLYVSGMKPDDIEKMLITTDWQKYIRTDFNRQDIPMRRKNLDYTYQGRLGLGINAENDLVLPTGVFKREPMLLKFMELTQNTQNITDFDKLEIPFRAVATNIENGDAVILKSGSLAKAIYASSSIPGGFQPININGIDLVDGGVSDNMPIQVARDMGADIIIAVDVSENFSKDLDVNSYFVVMGQLVNILMRKNANESIKTLTKKDILLTPDLDGFTGLDAGKYKEIIARGVEITEKNLKSLRKLSLSDSKYAKYSKHNRVIHTYSPPIIDAIRVENPTYLSNKSITNRIHQELGKPLDIVALHADLLHIYHMMIFDSVDFRLDKKDGKTSLVIVTIPSWDNHGEVRFAIGLEDDFKGHSTYSLKLGYSMYGLNAYGGEWRSDFEIGRYQKVYTEWFQPLDTMQRYYIRPSISFDSVTDILSTDTLNDPFFHDLGNQEIYSNRYGETFAAGAHITTNLELEIGVSMFTDNVNIDIINAKNKYEGTNIPSSYKYKARPIYARVKIDNLDNVNFPTVGWKSKLKWVKEMNKWGSDYNYEQVYFELEKPLTLNANNITLYLKTGTTYKNNEPDDMQRISGLFVLGGLFNMSGYAPYSFFGDNVFFTALKYNYEIKGGGFFGTLNAPLYAGFSLETGNAWDNGEAISISDMKKSASVFVAADTFLGPLYLAYAYTADGQSSAYFYLGEKF